MDFTKYEMILVGIGEEFNNNEDALKAYNVLAEKLSGKNYFIITLCTDDCIYKSDLSKDRIVAVMNNEDGQKDDELTRMWDKYLKWLTGTLNKSLLTLELGVSLKYPQIIRWPFEKIVFLNEKAFLTRVNEKIPQIGAEISGKGEAIKENCVKWLIEN